MVVRGSNQDGVIEISMVPRDAGLAVVIEAVGGDGAVAPAAPPSSNNAKANDEAGAIDTRLALAHTLIQAHGGHLELELRPGLGARATVMFPRGRLPGAAGSAA